MRKVLLNVAVTLDGFIAGPNVEYDWSSGSAMYSSALIQFIYKD